MNIALECTYHNLLVTDFNPCYDDQPISWRNDGCTTKQETSGLPCLLCCGVKLVIAKRAAEMGRRKSKTAKSRQKRVASKLAKQFSKKGGNPEVTVVSHTKIASGKSNSNSSVPKFGASTNIKTKKSGLKCSSANKIPRRSHRRDVQDVDFDGQRRSLFERQHQREITMTWKRNKPDKLVASTPFSSPFQLQPARFCVTDAEKTTSQIFDETLQKVEALTTNTEIDAAIRSVTQNLSTAVNLSDWIAPSEASARESSSNPWAVLQDDDEDEIKGKTSTDPAPPTFQFAPPTFEVKQSVSHPQNFSCDIDPDL